MGERAFAGRALHRQVQPLPRLSAFRLPFLLLSFLSVLKAQIVTAPAPHRQRHLTKIGAESEAFVAFIAGVTPTRMQVHRENERACAQWAQSRIGETLEGRVARCGVKRPSL
jgi:hypothetical protein